MDKSLTRAVDDNGGTDSVVRRVAAVMEVALASAAAEGLAIVATPIGNLGDITLRALATLARADVIYCEDTRHSRTLLDHYGIRRPVRPYHEHNAEAARPEILAALSAGKSLALISDAGTPLISDPGYKLVRDVVAAGHDVVALPGASATLAALSVGGLPTDAFLFAGFLPAKQMARRNRIAELKLVPATLVFFEAPSRVAEALMDIAEVLGARETAVARELTKLHEEVWRGKPADLAAKAESGAARGEFVIMVAPPSAAVDVTDEAIIARLAPMLAEMSLKDAVAEVAEALDVAKSRVYDLGLALKKKGR
jgi:16S rRNA (cytidine1402-2'-O)-methyltransferase